MAYVLLKSGDSQSISASEKFHTATHALVSDFSEYGSGLKSTVFLYGLAVVILIHNFSG
jgi:hypothetical protein